MSAANALHRAGRMEDAEFDNLIICGRIFAALNEARRARDAEDVCLNTHTPEALAATWAGLRAPVLKQLHEAEAAVKILRGTADDAVERLAVVERRMRALEDVLRDLLVAVDDAEANAERSLIRGNPRCSDCTDGATPDRFNAGPCAYHKAQEVLAERRRP